MQANSFAELTEAKRSRHPVRLNVVTDERLVWASVQAPRSHRNLGFRFRRARMLSQVLCPGGDEHFGPECPGIFQILLDAVKKSAIPQKDQTKLFNQRKEFFPVFRTNDEFYSDRDGPVIGLRCQREIVRSL
jgi:hypothetical protein